MQSSSKVYYHFLSARFALCDIEKRRLKVATFDDMNDPFELFGINLKNKKKRVELRKWRDFAAKRFGALCFSREWSNPLLWSHYGDGHRGICLGFGIGQDELERIHYVQERPEDETWNPTDDSGPIWWTKSTHWQYEAEHRRIVRLNRCHSEEQSDRKMYFWPFGEDLRLRTVVVGANCAEHDGLGQALGEMQAGVDIVKARLAFGSFNVAPRNDLVWRFGEDGRGRFLSSGAK